MAYGAVAVVALVILPLAAAQTSPPNQPQPDERGLASIWKQHIGNPADHARIIHLCKLVKAKATDDPLLAVTDGLTAWHMLKLGRTNEAVEVFETIAGASAPQCPLQRAAIDMARAWLTRIDREETTRALRRIYLEEIEYPISLDALAALPEDRRPPLADRWGKRWSYQLVGFRHIRGAAAQRYELHSVKLGPNSDLAGALARSYASGINLVPERYVHDPKEPAVIFRAPSSGTVTKETDGGGTIRLAPGQSVGGVRLAYLGRNSVILADCDHWLVMPKPEKKRQDRDG